MVAQRPLADRHAEGQGDLALTALKAAIQLNLLLKEQTRDTSPVRKLVEALQRTPGIGSPRDPQHLSTNPKAVKLLSGAFVDAQKEEMSTSQFLQRIAEVIQRLESHDPRKRRRAQEQTRAFCLSLHTKILADRFSLKETETVFGDGRRRLALR
jgi:hypothetical protein